MPRYHFLCEQCGEVTEVCMSIGEYARKPPAFFHCAQPQVRYFPPTGLDAIDNALAGDRHYEGLRATDGTDISSRTKHREYMKRHGLTTIDDFKGQWAKAEAARNDYRTSGKGGAVTRHDVAATVERLERL